MDMIFTLIAGATTIALTILFGWLGARPSNPAKGPRMAPWRPMMMMTAVATLLLAAHALNLLGLKTGDPRY
ncbi:MAG: hypothetical protein QM608_11255 [Caulobacter sp.]